MLLVISTFTQSNVLNNNQLLNFCAKSRRRRCATRVLGRFLINLMINKN